MHSIHLLQTAMKRERASCFDFESAFIDEMSPNFVIPFNIFETLYDLTFTYLCIYTVIFLTKVNWKLKQLQRLLEYWGKP